MATLRRTLFSAIGSLLLAMCVSHCSDPAPIRLGFVGGLSGSVSDLGGSARNGMLLAIEETNAQGGIHGRVIEVIIKDDKQDRTRVRKAVKELVKQKVEAIIGPVTSEMAMASVDLANAAKILMMGVTVTSSELSGKDDFFLRILSATSVHTAATAEHILRQLKIDNFSAIIDLKNASYSKSWINEFSRHFKSMGGRENNIFGFDTSSHEQFPEIAKNVLADRPGIILLVTNAVDSALLAKLIRTENPEAILGTSEWAGTERLVELGGIHVEQAIVPQFIDRASKEPAYLSFREKFVARFSQEPGFPGLVAYNATNVVLTGLKAKSSSKSLRDTLLETGTFSAIQGPVVFDEFGDGSTRSYITQIENGRFSLRNEP